VLDHAVGQAEEGVERPHPLGVAFGEVVVDGHDVHAAAEQRVRVDRQRRDEGLALARLHLGDLALVQDLTAHDLDVEVAHVQNALGGLAANREDLGQHVVERLALLEARPELGSLGLQLLVRERRDLRLERVDGRNRPPQARELPFVCVEEGFQKGHTSFIPFFFARSSAP